VHFISFLVFYTSQPTNQGASTYFCQQRERSDRALGDERVLAFAELNHILQALFLQKLADGPICTPQNVNTA